MGWPPTGRPDDGPAPKVVSGKEDEADTVEQAFTEARDAEATTEELLVDDGWKTVGVQPSACRQAGRPLRRTAMGTTTAKRPTSHSGRCSPGRSSLPRIRSNQRASGRSRNPLQRLSSSGRSS